MDLDAVADELVLALGTLTANPDADTRLKVVYKGPPGSVTVPCAVIPLPQTINFDQTYGRGSDRIVWPIAVIYGKNEDRTLMARALPAASGSGIAAVKTALESYEYQAAHSVRVVAGEFDTITWNGTDYQGTVFELDIFGPGS